jgi:ZIP family zinc transporter
MGFSAGVMVGVSVFEMLPSAIQNIGLLMAGCYFLLGMITVSFLDFIVPHDYIQEYSSIDDEIFDKRTKNGRMMRTGRFLAIGIAIHNFPEGFVTMTGTFKSLELGLLLAVAIAFHNIPEGLSVALPIYTASGDKFKAFKLSFLSGIAEPIGAIISVIVISTLGLISSNIIEISLAFVAGIMTFISLDELLPTAHANCYDNGDTSHVITVGIVTGLTIILFTIVLLK